MQAPIIAVTGSSGFIGRKFIRDAINQGYKVRALSRKGSFQNIQGVECLPFDLSKKTDLDPSYLSGCAAVVHLAAYIPKDQSNPEEASRCFETNALGTLRLLKAVEAASVPSFIHTVSANSYDSKLEVANESSPMFPSKRASYYLVSKMAQEIFAEHWSISVDCKVVSLRLGSIYGIGQNEGIISTMTKRLLEGDNITLVNDGVFGADFATVSDVSSALLLSINRNVSGPINIGSGARTTVRRIVELLLRHTNRNWSAVEDIKVKKLDYGFPALDLSKATSIGYQGTSIENGIKSVVESLKQ